MAFTYLRRKDQKGNIRGQRAEFDDVETHLRKQQSRQITPAVEVARRSEASNSLSLIAFLIDPFQQRREDIPALPEIDACFMESGAASRMKGGKSTAGCSTALRPAYYIQMKHLPRTTTGRDGSQKTSLHLWLQVGSDEVSRNVVSQPEGGGLLSPLKPKKQHCSSCGFRSLSLDPNFKGP